MTALFVIKEDYIDNVHLEQTIDKIFLVYNFIRIRHILLILKLHFWM